ncbi:MAG: PEGA domain-containing protein, partial [Vicinamibacterales bacterium]
ELAVQSRPIGARVLVDGKERGVTPITVALPSGAHVLEVQVGKAEPRVIPLTIQAGVQTAQYIELQGVQSTGTLEIKSEPSGARVLIDGQPRGTTPATIRDLSAGDHTVVLEAGGRKVTQVVKIDPGNTAQLVVPIPRR